MSVFILLLQVALGYPQGPNVSSGSNPIWNYIGSCSGLSYTVPVNSVLIITDIQKVSTASSSSYWLKLKLDGVSFFETYYIDLFSYQTGIKLTEGQVLTCQQNYNVNVMMSGYFTAP